MTGVLGGASGDPPEGAEALLVPPSALTGASEGDPPWGGADGASDASVSATDGGWLFYQRVLSRGERWRMRFSWHYIRQTRLLRPLTEWWLNRG